MRSLDFEQKTIRGKSLVYHKELGIGLVYDEPTPEKGLVIFCDAAGYPGLKIIQKKELSLFDQDFAVRDLLQEYESPYSYSVINKAEKYTRDGRVKNLKYIPEKKTITADIEGYDYRTYSAGVVVRHSQKPKKTVINYQCSCSDCSHCEHTAALLSAMNGIKRTLLNAYNNLCQFEPAEFLGIELLQLLLSAATTEKPDPALAKKLIPLVKKDSKVSVNHLCCFLGKLYDFFKYHHRQDVLPVFCRYILADKDIFNCSDSIILSLPNSKLRQDLLAEKYNVTLLTQTAMETETKDCCTLTQLRLFYDDKYEECLQAYTNFSKRPNAKTKKLKIDTLNILPYLPTDRNYSAKLQDNIAECIIKSANETCNDNEYLFGFIDQNHKDVVFQNPEYKGNIPIEYLKAVSIENFLKIIENKKFNTEIGDYVLERLEDFAEFDLFKTAKLIDMHYFGCWHNETKTEIIECTGKIPAYAYLSRFYAGDPERLHYSKRSLFDSEAQPAEVDKQLLSLFDFGWNINFPNEDSADYELSFYLMSPTGEVALMCTRNSAGKLTKVANFIDLCRKSPLFNYCIEGCEALFSEKIKAEINNHKAMAQILINKAMYDDFRKEAVSLAKLQSKKIPGKAEKYGIQLCFDTSDPDGYELWMKAGGSKKYVVTDAWKFLNSFSTCATTCFGKNYMLVHNISCFDEQSQRILKILLEVYERAYSLNSKKCIIVSKRTCSRLIEEAKGSEIIINNNALLLSRDYISTSIEIDSECRLNFKNNHGISFDEIIDFEEIILGINHPDSLACIIPLEGKDPAIYKFASKYNGMDVSPIKDVMKSYIMPYFRSSIAVPEALKKDFPLSNLKIETFFDYNDKELSYSEKIYSGKSQINASDIKSNEDQIHYGSYSDILEGMGFSEGKMKDESSILSFFRTDFSGLKTYCDVMLSDSIQNKQLSNFSKQSIQIRHKSNIMEAFLSPSDYSQEELELLYRAIKRKKKYALLSGDRIVALDNEFADDFKTAVEDLQLDPKKLYEKKKLSLAQSLRAMSRGSCCETDDYLSRMVDDIKNFKSYNVKMPSINGELRPYQEDAVKWLRVLSDYGIGGILADDMGLGKTLEIIALIKSDLTKKPSLILCPKSLVFNWKNEFAKFAPDENVTEIYGTAAERQRIISGIPKNEKRIYISSYDSLRSDIELYEKNDFNYVIADEAQNIKNTEAQKSKNTKKIKAAHKFALTGTPIENSVADLWSIFDFIIPGYFQDLAAFKAEYEGNENYAQIIARRIAPFLLRRTKQLVLSDLPDKYERVVTAEMCSAQRMTYDAYINKARQALEDGGKAFDMLPYITRLRQICVDPAMFIEGYSQGSGKLDMLKELLAEYIPAGHRVLIFSQFVKALESVEALLNSQGTPYYLLTGDTAADKRIEMAENFNSKSGTNVFLISLKAGGTGLNLTGADTVIHLDPWWNVSAENQASDRAHRIGQTRNVEVIKLICENSIEQRVVELQNMKKNTIDKLIAKDDTSVTNASFEDIAFILKE